MGGVLFSDRVGSQIWKLAETCIGEVLHRHPSGLEDAPRPIRRSPLAPEVLRRRASGVVGLCGYAVLNGNPFQIRILTTTHGVRVAAHWCGTDESSKARIGGWW